MNKRQLRRQKERTKEGPFGKKGDRRQGHSMQREKGSERRGKRGEKGVSWGVLGGRDEASFRKLAASQEAGERGSGLLWEPRRDLPNDMESESDDGSTQKK